MDPLDGLLASLSTEHNLKLDRLDSGWRLQLPRRGDFQCELAIGPETLEWYATVCAGNDAAPVWQDWMDYNGYGESRAAVLIEQKSRDIRWFAQAWCRAAQIRLKQTEMLHGLFSSESLEADYDGIWTTLQLFDPKTESD